MEQVNPTVVTENTGVKGDEITDNLVKKEACCSSIRYYLFSKKAKLE